MHLILTGATGLVGAGVLDAMLKTKDITRISILSRRPVPMAEDSKDSRVRVIIHKNFDRYDPEVLDQLKDADGCVWALGISQTKVDKEQYIKITKDYAIAAANAFSTLKPSNPPFRFVYVSGEGATQTPGRLTPFFGGVKGETESILGELSSKHPGVMRADSVRPAFVDPALHKAIHPYLPARGMLERVGLAVLGPPTRTFFTSRNSPTEHLGRFLTNMAMGKVEPEGTGAFRLGGGWVVENVGIRRILGL